MNPVLVVCQASKDLRPAHFRLLCPINSGKSLTSLQLLFVGQEVRGI
jgi:hypothetical protein